MAAIGNASTAQQPRSFGCHGWLVLKGAYIVFLIISIHSTVATNSLQLGSDQKVQNRGICQSVDIRNTLDSFSKLEGCRVVEGFVQILLFDNVNEVELANISFPELTEITDYLLLYRVYGLRSVGQLFPNLSVIRGQNPFFSHSLVIFEMSSLQEIALPSLTDILKGLIRIDKNPSLCFVNSIDWDLIAHEKGEHFIKSMKPQNECPICPGEEQKRDDSGSAVRHCPRASPKLTTDRFPQDKYLCWNRQHCQRVCPSNCRSCTANGTCCSSSCLGGCSITNTSQCTVCRNLTLMENDDSKCVDKCPQNFFEFLGRRCVSLHECEKMKRPFDPHYRSGEYPYKIYNNESCVLQCPQNYTPDEKQHRCLPCEGRCKKECSGVNIDSTALAKQLNGCTHITSSLEIQIRGGLNIVNELEVNLGMIEEIFGYLKIVRSFPLVSLNFLKSLKRIRGKHLESDKYSLIVLDNQNLQDLWDWQNDTRNLTIERGKLFFHFNPKLCINKIKKLQQKTGVSPFDELEVAPNSNGDKVPCDVVELNVTLTKITAEAVIMTWKSFSLQDHRQLLGYIVYSVKSPYKNMTWYDSRDACGGDDWRVDDVPISENESTTTNAKTTHMVAHLKPFTQYAFYVKTYTISTEKKGAQSNISYFTTLPDKPSPPRTLIVSSNSSDTLKIIWEPPQFPNGNVTYYMVTGKKEKDQYLGRDYCSDARPDSSSGQVQPSQSSGPAPTTSTNSSDTCPCENKTPNPGGIDEEVELLRINFENELQNEVYHKRTDLETRKKRNTPRMSSAPNDFVEGLQHNTTSSQSEIKNVTINGIWQTFNFTVYSPTMELVVNGLQHATSYEISVRACRDIFSNTEKDHCSNNSLQSRKTLKKDGADRIVGLQVTNQSLDMVHVTWTEPSDPNGQVIAYIIRYKRVDMDKSRHNDDCIQKNDFNISNQVYTLKKLLPGNYSLTVRAITSGNYADRGAEFCVPIYFVIPEPSNYAAYIVVASLFVILTFLLLAWYFYHKRKMSSRASMRLIPSVNPEYVPSMYEPDEWEVPRRNITLCRELGQGSFGMVYEGLAKDIKGWAEIKCAVKTVNEHATARERLEFLNEASVMKAFDTSHVVRLLGVVSEGQPTLVIMELMAHGDLKTYLRSHRPDSESNQDSKSLKQPPSLRQIMQMAIEISDGMAYLSAKKFVHRDLAARNCMVSENLTVKIGDFGMTRDIYETDYYRKGTKGLLPVRWMAPESLKDGVFTSHSDVWSYGVVLWEMATLASQPYQGLSNDQVLRYVIDGGVMERPEKCPDKLYSLMRYCWQHKPSSRPTFLKLCSLLLEDSNENFVQVSFYHSAAGIEARNSRPTPSPSQDDASTPLRMVEDLDNRFSLTTDSDDEFQNVERQLTFPSISVEGKDGLSTANGYVSGCPTNGAATTQC